MVPWKGSIDFSLGGHLPYNPRKVIDSIFYQTNRSGVIKSDVRGRSRGWVGGGGGGGYPNDRRSLGPAEW